MASVGSGASGYIEIRDTGSTVEFWVGCSDPSTHFGSASWSGTVNGTSVGGLFGFSAGQGSVMVANYPVSTSQTVSFGIGSTGTSGLGGPTSMSLFVNRTPPATVPPAPRVTGVGVGLDMITQTNMRFRFDSNGDGGSPILRWEYQAATNPAFSGVGAASNGFSGTVYRTDLPPNTEIFWHARGVNAVGNGPWSATLSARTLSYGFYGGKSGSFVPFPTTIGKSGAFTDTQIYVGKGGTFVPLA